MKKQPMRNCVLLTVIYWGSVICSAFCHAKELRFDNWSSESGLSSATVLALQMDREGYLWVGSFNGIDVFDGSVLKTFNVNQDHNKLSASLVFSLEQDETGHIWAGTKNGLNQINPKTGHVQRYYAENSPLTGNIIRAIKINKDKDLVAATNKGLTLIEHKDKSLSPIPINNISDFGGKAPNVRDVNFDKSGAMYLLTSNYGVCKYISASKHCAVHIKPDSLSRFTTFYIDSDDRFWVAHGNNEVTVYDVDGNHLKTLALSDGSRVVDINQNPKNLNIWLAVLNGPIKIYDNELQLLSEVNNKSLANKAFTATSTTSIYFYGDDIWLTTASDGIYKRNQLASSFTHVVPEGDFADKTTWSFYQESPSHLWVGGSGWLIRLNPEESFKKTADIAVDGYVKGLSESVTGDLLVLTSKGIKMLVKDNCCLKESPPINELESPANHVYQIVQNNGRNYIASDAGVLVETPAHNSVKTRFTKLHEDSHADTNGPISFSIAISADNEIFYGGFAGTVWKHNPDTKITSKLFNVKEVLGQSAIIWQLSFYDDDTLIIATDGNGLLGYNLRTQETRQLLNRFESLQGAVISLLVDHKNLIWHVSNQMLIGYDPNTDTVVRALTFDDGLQSNDFTTRALSAAPGGCFYVGGTRFFNHICPDKLADRSGFLAPKISRFQLDYEPISKNPLSMLNSAAGENASLWQIDHKTKQLGVNFHSRNFSNYQYVGYEYRLKGFDDRWIPADNYNPAARYTSLPAGTYSLELSSFDQLDPRRRKTYSVALHVAQNPFLSGYAIVSYIILLVSSVFFLVKYKTRQTRKANEILKQKVRERTQAIEAQKEQLNDIAAEREELLLEKNELLTMISHEMKTPLAVIKGSTDSLKRSPEHKEKQKLLKLISDNSNRLTTFVKQVLYTSKMTQTATHNFKTVSVSDLLRESISDLADLSEQYNHTMNLDITPDCFCHGGEFELSMMMTNLVKNAINHSGDGSHIEISLIKHNAALKLEVVDNGKGIPKDKLDGIFDPRTRLRSQSRYSGFGLGLVKNIVDCHSGQISCRSTPEIETVFSVELPAVCASKSSLVLPKKVTVETDKPLQITKPNAVVSQKLQLLVVDDEPDILELLELQLSDEYQLRFATNGSEALESIAQETPDILLLDQMLPDTTGIEIAEQLKKDKHTSIIPILMFSASDDESLQVTAMKKGADGFLNKPVALDLLTATLNGIYARRLEQRYVEVNARQSQQHTQAVSALLEKRLTNLLADNFQDHEFNVTELSAGVFMTERTLQRKMKEFCDLTPTQYIAKYRCEKAVAMLQSQSSIEMVASASGFSSSKQMRRWFGSFYDSTPTAVLTQTNGA